MPQKALTIGGYGDVLDAPNVSTLPKHPTICRRIARNPLRAICASNASGAVGRQRESLPSEVENSLER
jgi:hypothetical protein